MPQRAPRPCRKPGCRATTTAAHGYCDDHQSLSSGWNRTYRGSAHSRGYGASWRKRRLVVLRRDDWLCQPCLSEGRLVPATEVDHRIPKSQGGTDDPENLQGICSDCHREKTAREARGQAQGEGAP